MTSFLPSIHTDTTLNMGGQGILTLTDFEPTLTNWWLAWDIPVMLAHAPPPPNWAQFSLQALDIPGLVIAMLGMLGLQRRRKAKLAG